MLINRDFDSPGELLLAGPVNSDKNPGPVSSPVIQVMALCGRLCGWKSLTRRGTIKRVDAAAGPSCGNVYGEPMIFPMASDPRAPSYNLKSAMAPEK
jgi:hypothetical protein